METKEIKAVWVSEKQKDGHYSALAVHDYTIGGYDQQDTGFIRRAKSFKANEALVAPEGYAWLLECTDSGDNWKLIIEGD